MSAAIEPITGLIVGHIPTFPYGNFTIGALLYFGGGQYQPLFFFHNLQHLVIVLLHHLTEMVLVLILTSLLLSECYLCLGHL